VTERPVRRWRQARLAGGAPGLASTGPAARCRLEEARLAELDRVPDAGPPLRRRCRDRAQPGARPDGHHQLQ
jgi:hypothetical protein